MIKKIYGIYCRIEDILVGAGFFTIVALTFLNAVLRIFNRPIITADDISLLLFGWVAFLGADVALRYSRLVGMDILVTKFPPKVQKTLQIVVYSIMIVALVLFAQQGFILAMGNWKRAYNTLPISYGWVTLSLPVCCCLMTLTCAIKIAKIATHFKDDSFDIKKDSKGAPSEVELGSDESIDISIL